MDVLVPLLPGSAPHEYVHRVSHVKRFLEWYSADPRVREECLTQPAELAARLGVDVQVEDVRPLWDAACHTQSQDVTRYRAFIQEKLDYRDRVRDEGSPAHPRMRAWRERQINRSRLQIPSGASTSIVHAPMTLEICRGCSVGCWFCGVSAPKLSETWLYTEANASLWQAVLLHLRDVLGPAAEQGFGYWATDPMDNPDYEKFMLDFARLLGRFPQTTTALALKNVARTRALLDLSRDHGCGVNRFSLLTLGQVRKVMQSFTPEELLYVELVLQNPESTAAKAAVGRAREHHRPEEIWGEGTIACVTGFHVNMVDRTLQVMTPSVADDSNPQGYYVLARTRFTDADDFGRQLARLTSFQVMPDHLTLDQPARFWPWLSYEDTDDGFRLTSPYAQAEFKRPDVRAVGRLVRDGQYTVADIANHIGGPRYETLAVLEELFALGVLEERTETLELG